MKKLSLLLATCGLALLATTTPALAQGTPPPVYTGCTASQYTKSCWADVAFSRGIDNGSRYSYNEYITASQQASAYADYYRAQPYSDENACLTVYWDYYLDGLATGYWY